MSALCQLLCASLVIITAQNEEMFYSCGFGAPLDWIEDIGTFNPDIHTFIPIKLLSESTYCPRAAAGDTSTDATTCVQTKRDASISRIISAIGFHSIHLQIDVKAAGVDKYEDEWCIIQYRTATTNWTNTNMIHSDGYFLNFTVFIPDNDVYNNQESFEVKIGNDADAGPDNCYFDNLKLFGVPLNTETPTLDTNYPTTNPSRSPLVEETLYPTKHASNLPTKQPTETPTSHPSTNPTKLQTVSSTFNPTMNPNANPTETSSITSSSTPTSIPTTSDRVPSSVNPTTFSPVYVPITSLIAKPTAILSQSTQNTLAFREQTNNVFISKPISETNDASLITTVILLSISVVALCIISAVLYFKVYQARKYMFFVNTTNKGTNDDIKPQIVNVDDDELQCWFRDSVKLPQYHSRFVEYGYDDMSFINNIKEQSDLKAIGIKAAGHRTRIWAEIKILRNADIGLIKDKRNPDSTEGMLNNEDLCVVDDTKGAMDV